MKTNFIITLSIMLLAAGCRKESIQSFENEKDDNAIAAKAKSSGGCRMTFYDYYNSLVDFHQTEHVTYKNGLVDEWLVSYGMNFKMEYENKKLKTSRAYDGETLLYTIHFIYKNNKVVKEIWYEGSTQNVDDEVNITYNRKGQMIQNESINYDYYVTYTYYANGSLKSWHFFLGGHPSQTAEYTYNAPYRNPWESTSGVDYSFFYVNSGFGAGSGKRWYSSEKITLYDEQENPYVDYEQDPERTVWQTGHQNYPLLVNYVDKLSQLPITNSFEYENCIPGQEEKARRIQQKNINKNNRFSLSAKPILNGLSQRAIEKLRKSK